LVYVQFLRHAGRELDVEVFDREFAGDEARQQFVARLFEPLTLLLKQMLLPKQRLGFFVKAFQQII
jgi:hypothetical protein